MNIRAWLGDYILQTQNTKKIDDSVRGWTPKYSLGTPVPESSTNKHNHLLIWSADTGPVYYCSDTQHSLACEASLSSLSSRVLACGAWEELEQDKPYTWHDDAVVAWAASNILRTAQWQDEWRQWIRFPDCYWSFRWWCSRQCHESSRCVIGLQAALNQTRCSVCHLIKGNRGHQSER